MKKVLLSAALVMFATSAVAQEKEFEFKNITATEVNILGKALGKLPYDDVAGLIEKLKSQIVQQNMPKPQEVPATAEPAK